MSKLCVPYESPPPSNSFLSDLTHHDFSDDFQIHPDNLDIFDLPSICSDIQKIESDPFLGYGGSFDLDFDLKREIRNTDLMWCTSAQQARIAASPSSSSLSSDIGIGVSLADVMTCSPPHNKRPSLQIKVEEEEFYAPTVVTAKNLNPMSFKQEIVQIKQEPTEDVEQQLAYNSIPNIRIATSHLLLQNAGTASMHNMPAGTSLLRKSQQQQHQQRKTQQQMRGTVHITKRGDQLLPSASAVHSASNYTSTTSTFFNTSNDSSPNTSFLYQRPDTPHSLYDDCSTPEFKHNVDLRACVMGSNNISLTTDQDFIKNVSQELQDTSKKQIDSRFISNCSLTDVLDIINNSANCEDFLNLDSPPTTSSLTPSITSCSSFSNRSANYNASMRSSESDSDEESMIDSSSCSLLDNDLQFNAGGVSPVSSQMSNGASSTQHYMQHRDHSYTRCKDGRDDLSTNLETPSDSEEEIDVVSLNDKKLPTNPSDKDRRVLQTKVAHKFSAARIVKTPNGLRTIPPRRDSYEYPYTPASSSPMKSRLSSPAVTPFHSQYTTKYVQQQQQQMMTVVDGGPAIVVPINVVNAADKSRKRLIVNGENGSINQSINNNRDLGGAVVTSVVNLPPSKKHRGKKTKLVTALQFSGVLKRHYSVDETADTIEKRNLHNDMERQRRVGLKNLFETLKKQIPSIKDKERAPKVTILREAAKLCEALTREDQQLNEQKATLKEELRRKQELLAQLKAAQYAD